MKKSVQDRMKEAEERHEKLKRVRAKKMEDIEKRSEEREKESERISKRVQEILAKY